MSGYLLVGQRGEPRADGMVERKRQPGGDRVGQFDRVFGQLFQEERVALAERADLPPGVGRQTHRRRHRGVDQSERGGLVERFELEMKRAVAAPDVAQRRVQWVTAVDVLAAIRPDEANAEIRQGGRDEAQEVETSGIGPMQILEHQQRRLFGAESHERLAGGLEHPALLQILVVGRLDDRQTEGRHEGAQRRAQVRCRRRRRLEDREHRL